MTELLKGMIELIGGLGAVTAIVLASIQIRKSAKKQTLFFASLKEGASKRAIENRLIYENMCSLTEVGLLTLDYLDGIKLNGEVKELKATLHTNKCKQQKYLLDLINADTEKSAE